MSQSAHRNGSPALRPSGPYPAVAELLTRCRDGDAAAFDEVYALLYDELRELARRHLHGARRDQDHTLSTTALVHESYLRLAGADPRWRDCGQFFATASKAMRHILVDHARRNGARKRGGGLLRVTLDDARVDAAPPAIGVLDLDVALTRLGEYAPRLEQVVECRFFGGLTMEETADTLGVSLRTVERDWTRAKTYLLDLLSPAG